MCCCLHTKQVDKRFYIEEKNLSLLYVKQLELLTSRQCLVKLAAGKDGKGNNGTFSIL